MEDQSDDPFEHQRCKRQEVESRQRWRETFIVTSKAPKAGRPPETAFTHPAAGEKDEAGLSVRELAHLQADAPRCRLLDRLCPGIALIDKGEGNPLSGHRSTPRHTKAHTKSVGLGKRARQACVSSKNISECFAGVKSLSKHHPKASEDLPRRGHARRRDQARCRMSRGSHGERQVMSGKENCASCSITQV